MTIFAMLTLSNLKNNKRCVWLSLIEVLKKQLTALLIIASDLLQILE